MLSLVLGSTTFFLKQKNLLLDRTFEDDKDGDLGNGEAPYQCKDHINNPFHTHQCYRDIFFCYFLLLKAH